MTSRKLLKQNARDLLDNNIFTEKWLLLALFLLVEGLILSVSIGTSPFTAGLTSLLQLIIGGAIELGVTRGLIGVATKEDDRVNFNKLISGFDSSFTQSLVHYLMKTLMLALWTLLFIIPGIIKSYSYALSFYYLNENTNMSWNECLKKSQEKMKGHKWELFVLDLSFIGWNIVSVVFFGIPGLLWVNPYYAATNAELYEELKDVK